jgi:hypothetical protein
MSIPGMMVAADRLVPGNITASTWQTPTTAA